MARSGGVPTLLFVAGLALGLVLALARGVRLGDFAEVELRAGWTFVLAAALEALDKRLALAGRLDPATWGRGLEFFALALLAYGLYRNLHVKSLWLIVAGYAGNTLMILIYGGQMPVTAGAMKAAGLGRFVGLVARRGDGLHVLARPDDPLWWLGDTIPLRYQVISVGDLLITLGLALVVLELGLRAKARRIGAVNEHG